jgi:hypothetical protein
MLPVHEMNPLFIATEPFTPQDGDRWRTYIQWSGLTQLTEVVSLDQMLCPPILTEIKPEYWPHVVNEDFMLHYFLDLDFLKHEIVSTARRNLMCVLRNPAEEPTRPPVEDFRFLGYDLVDVQNSVSALTNCGGFPEVFSNSELSSVGLLADFRRAVQVQAELRSRYPEESHANCNLWAIFRSTT